MQHQLGVNTIEASQLIERPRLTSRLLGRFEHRVSTVVAPGGSGKTAALTLAIRNNQLDPVGHDVWLEAHPSDNDPVHLLATIAQALGIGTIPDETDGTRRIHDAVWSHAPLDIVIVIDEAQEIVSPESVGVLTTLIRDLPANGHVVFVARSTPLVPLARLRAHRQLLELTSDDLEFDDAELDALCRRRRGTASSTDLPRHAATADLQLAVGSHASIEFLWQEVLAGLEPDRLASLRMGALVEDLDDHLALGLSDGQFDVSELVAGLPLIDRRADGVRRMHRLLRDALVSGLDPSDRRKGLERAAALEASRGRAAEAVRLYHAAGHDVAAQDVARQLVMEPLMRQTISDITSIRQIVASIAPDSALVCALEASLRYGGLPQQVVPLFRATAEAAKREGDDQLEALALHRLNQAGNLGVGSIGPSHSDRVEQLGRAGGFAAGAAAHLRSVTAQLSGNVAGALAPLDAYDHFGPVAGPLLRAERLCDLGHPEQAAFGLGTDDLADLPVGLEIVYSFAMWLRGDAVPELAQAVVSQMMPAVTRRGGTHPILSILGVGTVIALAAGDNESARVRARRVRDLCDRGVGDTSSLFADVAVAAVTAVDEGDVAVAQLLHPDVIGIEFSTRVTRAHLLALPLLYVTLPQIRSLLDRAAYGPALSTAIAAGRAIVELRETGSADSAARLPWTLTNVLRAHILPPHLVELACAAADAGNDDAATLLMTLPNLASNLARVEDVSAEPARRYANVVLGGIPRQPPTSLRAVLLGSPQLFQNDRPMTSDDWRRRPAVRDLCALLLDRRRLARADVIELLWPGHDNETKTQSNLRSLLSTLQRVLEPDRPKGTDPFFLRADGEFLAMDASVSTDVDQFEALMTSAIADDQAGSPASALQTYLEALALYGGDFLEGTDASWLVMTRLRLHALATNGMCRVSELIAARGEPEDAARWAQRACLSEPLDQRAWRLFASALDASGQRASARTALAEMLTALAEHGVEIDRSTTRLIERLQL